MVMTGIAHHPAALILAPHLGIWIVAAILEMDVITPHLGVVIIGPQLAPVLMVYLPQASDVEFVAEFGRAELV